METVEQYRTYRAQRPKTLVTQYKNEFGETHADDRPWPRGYVIYAGRGSPRHANNPSGWRSGYRPRGGGGDYGGGLHLGSHTTGYNQYDGPPIRRPYRPGYRGRRKFGYPRGGGNGMCSAWNGSMPYGLQNCGYNASQSYPFMDDGYIDDTLLSNLSQFSLYDDSNWKGSTLISNSGNQSRLAIQSKTLAKDCASTPHLARTNVINRPNTVYTRIAPGRESVMSSSLSPTATSDASNPVDRLRGLGDHSETTDSTSSPEPSNVEQERSPSSVSALRSPADFLTLVWDIST